MDLIIPSKANLKLKYSGIDSIEKCQDPEYFLSYPNDVDYTYNSRGFRDAEWPEDLNRAIWCIGDSFTLGLGAPATHTWPSRLAALTQKPTINISLDGASNEWIARTANKIINNINPDRIVIMWSFTHRRESNNLTLSDEQRLLHYVKSTVEQDWQNFLNCRKDLNNVIEFVIPNFHLIAPEKTWQKVCARSWPVCPKTIEELTALPEEILHELKTLHRCYDELYHAIDCQEQLNRYNVTLVEQLDFSRDGFHFDIVTADWVAAQVQRQL